MLFKLHSPVFSHLFHYNYHMRTKLTEEIRQYKPYNEQEAKDQSLLLELLGQVPDLFYRANLSNHMTASAWVVNPSFTHILMAYHRIYDSWAWLGGHADGEEDLLKVAIREVQEESGIHQVVPVLTDLFSLEILTVDGHEKNGSYVPSHLHLNITYLLMADDKETPHSKPDENKAVAWFPIETVIEQSSEPWFRERIYSKLNKKLLSMRPMLKQLKASQ